MIYYSQKRVREISVKSAKYRKKIFKNAVLRRIKDCLLLIPYINLVWSEPRDQNAILKKLLEAKLGFWNLKDMNRQGINSRLPAGKKFIAEGFNKLKKQISNAF